MLKRILLALALLSAPALAWDAPKMDRQINHSVYTLDIGKGHCTGFAFSLGGPTYIGTAGHCADPAFKTTALQMWSKPDGTKVSVTVPLKFVAKDAAADVGLYSIDTDAMVIEKITIAPAPPIRGEDVYIAGSPYGDHGFLTKGILSHDLRVIEDSPWKKETYGVDAASYAGNSGSPVYNDKGEVFGILVGGFEMSTPWGQTIPLVSVGVVSPVGNLLALVPNV